MAPTGNDQDDMDQIQFYNELNNQFMETANGEFSQAAALPSSNQQQRYIQYVQGNEMVGMNQDMPMNFINM